MANEFDENREEENEEPAIVEDEAELWLTSYADMMTLIACFFILMMAFANYDPTGFAEKVEIIAKHFSKDDEKERKKLEKSQEEIAMHKELKDKLKMKASLKDGELVLIFSGSILFKDGSFKLEDDMLSTLDTMIDILKTENQDYRILVEGHADDVEYKGDINTPWLISSARAASIIERFEYFGFPRHNLVAIGKADYDKINQSAPSKTLTKEEKEALAKLNRRVVIRVLEPRARKKVKLGLGTYFEEASSE